jgi:hypothetical protein
MPVVANPPFADGQILTANGGSNPTTAGLNQTFADCLSLSQATQQTITGPLQFNGDITVAGTWTSTAAEVQHVTIVTAGNYSCLNTDAYVLVNKTIPSNTQIVLLASPPTGRLVTIKDAAGNCSQYPITITAGQNIDGVAGSTGIVLNNNFASVDLIFNGQTWSIL